MGGGADQPRRPGVLRGTGSAQGRIDAWGPWAPHQWQRWDPRLVLGPAADSAGTGPNPDWASRGLGGPGQMMSREHLVDSEQSMEGKGGSGVIIM